MKAEVPKHCYFPTDERKREIAAAARAIIIEKGFEGLRTREVAARVGINIATLHYHVPSKDALIALVADSLANEFYDHYAHVLTDGLSPLEALKRLIDDYKDVMINHPELLQLMDAMGHKAATDSAMAARIGEMRRFWVGLLTKTLTEGRDSGAFRASLNPEAAAHMIVGALVAFQYKPKHLLPLFDSVADEIILSITNGKTSHDTE